MNRYLAINIEGKIGQLTVIRTSSFNKMKKAKIPQSVKEAKSIPAIQKYMTAHFLACTSIKSEAQTFPQGEMMWSCIINTKS